MCSSDLEVLTLEHEGQPPVPLPIVAVDPGSGGRVVRFPAGCDSPEAIEALLARYGSIPLPPYIHQQDDNDDRRYQTCYASRPGAVAAPTAGLHFTRELLERLHAGGVETCSITLHVGYGTFQPVRVEEVEAHRLHPERYEISPATADAIARARTEQRRVIAVGTTTTRALESLTVAADGSVEPASGDTRLFLHPGHEFKIVSGMVTNFHLPKSSLLMLVAALGGREPVLAAYREAVARGYRFYSYGDAMLIV